MNKFEIKFEFVLLAKKYQAYKNGRISGRWIAHKTSEPIYYGIPNYTFTIYGSYAEHNKLDFEMRSKDKHWNDALFSNLIESANRRNTYYGENLIRNRWGESRLRSKSDSNIRPTYNDFFILEFFPVGTEAIIYVAPNCLGLNDREILYKGNDDRFYADIDSEDFEEQKSQLKALLKPISHTLLLEQIIGKNLINDERVL